MARGKTGRSLHGYSHVQPRSHNIGVYDFKSQEVKLAGAYMGTATCNHEATILEYMILNGKR